MIAVRVAETLLLLVMTGVLAVLIGIPDLACWAWRKAGAVRAGHRKRRPGRTSAPDGNAKRKQDCK